MAAKNTEHPTRVLISSARKPISYLNTCKRVLQEHGEVHLSALGVAISSLVTVAEILKSRGLADEKKISTMLEARQDSEDASKTKQKPKMEAILTKSAKFDEIMAAEEKEEEAKKAAAAAAAAENGGGGDAAK